MDGQGLQALDRVGQQGPLTRACLVLDQAGWHTSPKLRIPENVSLAAATLRA